ncbi:MAG: glycosyltransferase family 2 protein [Candidatus Thermochlorobacter sp.]
MKVCVLLSTYNGETYLAEQLESIFRQEQVALSLYVRDDGSQDRTWQILSDYARQYRHLRLFRGENLGAAKSFFWLLEHADAAADYFSFSDQDDVWHPDKLARALAYLSQADDSAPLLYFSRFEIVDAQLRHLAYSPRARRLGFANALVQNQATGCTMVFNRTLRSLILSALPERTIMHDWWIYLVASAFGTLLYDETPTLKYRQHTQNAIGTSVTLLNKMQRHWKSLTQGNSRIFRLSQQAREFEKCFGAKLAAQESRILQRFLQSKQQFSARIGYLLTGEALRQSFLDNVILKTVIALNRY